MKRKILSLILAFAMTVSLFAVGAVAAEPTYGDTAGHWAESAIERWSGHGIIQGSNGEFDPNGQLTCAQLATILAKLLKLPAATDAGFNDNAAGAWYYDAINRCAAAGILNGNGDGTVDPNGAISRERAMVMLGRALGIQPIENPDLTKFSDAAKVASYAQGMVAALIEKGVVGGVTSDTLAPQDDINRASTVTILDRAIRAYADKTGGVIKVDGTGIVIVVADDVTITGDVKQVIIPADNVDVTIRGCENIDSITVTGENSKVILENSSASDVTLDSRNTEIETKGNSKVDTVNVTEDAAGATVNAGSGTTIGSVENKAEDTTVTGNGSVKEVASDKDMTVETKNTEVKNTGDEKISVTDKNGKTTETAAGGSSTTTGGSSGSSSGSSSHSHSYNDETHKCSCGQFDPAVVATIGNEKGYLTLADAVAAVKNNETITILKDINNAAGISINTGKTFTIDFGGHTYTVNKPGAGSTGTETAAFQLIKDQTITFKNGTIRADAENLVAAVAPAKNIMRFFQSYANVNFVDMTIDGTNIYNNYSVIEFANGTVSITGDTSITAKSGAKAINVDTWKNDSYSGGAHVTINTTGHIDDIYLYSEGTGTEFTKSTLTISGGEFGSVTGDAYNEYIVSISGGTFTSDPSDFLAAGYVATETSDGSGIWTVVEREDASFVAQVGNGKYTTLADAIAAAQNGDTVTLLDNVTASNITLKSGTLDLGGYTLDAAGATTNLGLRAANGVDVTIKNGIVKNAYSALTIWGSNESSKPTKVTVARDVTFTESSFGIIFTGYSAANDFKGKTGYAVLDFNGTITTGDNQCPIFVMGNLGDNADSAAAIGENGNQINIGATARITSEEEGIVLNGMAKLSVVDGATITGADAITMKRGYLNITGGTFTGTGDKHVPTDAEHSGAEQSGSAITVSSTYNYSGLIDVKISGGTFESANSYGFYAGQSVENDNPIAFTNTSFAISGGNFSGGEAAVYFADGKFITGGTFSSDPSDYAAARYTAEMDPTTNLWTVREKNWNEYPADGSVLPSGLEIEEFTQTSFDSANGKTGTITIENKDALLYFAYRLDPSAAYNRCSEAHGTGWGHTCVWYSGAYTRHVVLAADIDLEGMERSNGFGNFASFDFDGQNHKISNVIIKSDGNVNTGLFAGNNRGIKNLVVENVTVVNTSGSENCVGIVSSDANAKIENVTVKSSSVTGGKYTGAIVGYNYGDVTGCTVENCTVFGQYKVGGIVGYICNSPKDDDPDSKSITGNTLTDVTVKAENVPTGKTAIVGKIVGNWNAITGTCTGNTFNGTTDATNDIGKIESRCINVVTSQPTT